MATAKEHIAEIIKRQPDDSSYDDIVRELAFDLMVQRGLKDSDEGRTISNEEMKRRIKIGISFSSSRRHTPRS
jgi:hypothetical protein